MDEIDCLQIEIIELQTRIVALQKLVQEKLAKLAEENQVQPVQNTK